MNELAILSRAEPREILRTVIEKKTPAVLSYLSKDKWHVAKVLLTSLGENNLDVQVSPRKIGSILRKSRLMPTQKPPSINIQVHQPVGISLKYGYGKFIFETTVVAVRPSTEPASGPTIALVLPERIELIQRRSYFRVGVPSSLKVKVMLWHCRYTEESPTLPSYGDGAMAETQSSLVSSTEDKGATQTSDSCRMYWQGKLMDISAGGLQILVDAGQKPDFKRGQFIGLRFTPMPYEMPLMFNAQIRSILPTAGGNSICLGLRIVGLEASPEGRQVLRRLCSVAEYYYQINQGTPEGRDFQIVGSPR
ncbi:MAG: PilZ domain-containing protein [Phycisphaerae bacterium]|nr:PilZ domain-containing protein [Phycisphaerae bacterium]MDD5380481.1 PilZ domain-containing protein [Phycisphaerae bacterium]